MANSDKNILITPNTGSANQPAIVFTGAGNTPLNLRVLDDGTVSFEGTAGQLFSISDGMSGTIFSVNDISGIPSVEVLDTGLVKLAQYNGDVVVGSSAALLNGSSVAAEFSVQTSAATKPAMILRGFASQSANLQEWQDSTGAVKSFVRSDGFFRIDNGFQFNTMYSNTAKWTVDGGNSFRLTSGDAAALPLIVRGAASQSVNLTEWQDSSGTRQAHISSGGNYVNTPGLNVSYISTFTAGGAAVVPITVKGAASQTANLQEWQSSAGTVVAQVNASGDIFGRIFNVGTNSNWGGMLNVNTFSATNIGIAIRGQASQTADLQQWQNSSGNVVTNITAAGVLSVRRGNALRLYNTSDTDYVTIALTGSLYFTVNYNSVFGDSAVTSGAQLTSAPTTATKIGLVVRGAASQTANLQEWQNSAGGVVARLQPDGAIVASTLATTNTHVLLGEQNSGGSIRITRQTASATNPGANIGRLYFRDGTTAGTLKLVVRAGTAGAETTILDNIPQS